METKQKWQVKGGSPALALTLLKYHRAQLTKQQYRTLRGQALACDPQGALKGLKKILDRTARQ